MRTLDREQLLAELRALRPEFERGGVTRMSLFGSRARGDNRDDSDVDLIVDIDPERKFSLIDAAHIYGIVEDSIGLESSVLTRAGISDDPYFAARVSSDEVLVF